MVKLDHDVCSTYPSVVFSSLYKPTPYGRGHVGLAMPVPNGLG